MGIYKKNSFLDTLLLKQNVLFIRFIHAEQLFLTALKKVQAIKHQAVAVKWEPLLNNLGHVCRKLKQVF